MKKIMFLLFLGFVGLNAAHATTYKLNEPALDLAFETSEDVTFLVKHLIDGEYDVFESYIAQDSEKNATVGAILAFAGPVAGYVVGWVAALIVGALTGGFAIFCTPLFYIPMMLPYHRFYLGTGGNGFKIGALYCVTLNWCGFLSFIDGIMILIDDADGSKYIENPKYVMWAGN